MPMTRLICDGEELDLLANKAVLHSCAYVSNKVARQHLTSFKKLLLKFNGKHMSVVHVCVKIESSCTIAMYIINILILLTPLVSIN